MSWEVLWSTEVTNLISKEILNNFQLKFVAIFSETGDISFRQIVFQVSGLPIAGCLVMLVLDTLLYGVLAAWLDNIIPTE